MQNFMIKEIINSDIKTEIDNIGFDKGYSNVAKNKFLYKNIKIYNVTSPQANILKQTALSVGADCATNKNVIIGNIQESSCILGGSISQLLKIAEKLKHQPFKLQKLGEELKNFLNETTQKPKTKVMGILNITPDSFSDGNQFFEFDSAIKHLNELIEDGADIIDIGAESTKPYSNPVSTENQLEKLLPILNYINQHNIEIPISIDTRSALVASECIKNGAQIINDVSGLDYDKDMINIIKNNPKAKIIIGHSQGNPQNMQDNPTYSNLMDEIYLNLFNKIKLCVDLGIKKDNIILDPGIGFGKTVEDNFEILRRWAELKTTGCEVLIGLSRKSLLQIPDADNSEKDLYTLALDTILISNNIDYIRVHNVKIHKNLINMIKHPYLFSIY